MLGLAVVGDDRAWSPAHARLVRVLNRPAPSYQPPRMDGSRAFKAIDIVTYLVRHLDEPAGHRKRVLVKTLRRRFDRLYTAEQQFLTAHWPGVDPDGPGPDHLDLPNPEPFRTWSRHPLFGPVF